MEYLGHADEAIIAISNYRLHIKFKDSVINVSVESETLKRAEKPTNQGYRCSPAGTGARVIRAAATLLEPPGAAARRS